MVAEPKTQSKPMHRLEFMATRLMIEPKEGGKLVPLVANEAQCRVFAAMQDQIDAGLPVKIIVLKARQLGCTTGVAGWFFMDCLYKPNMNALIAAHNDDATSGIYRKYQRFDKNLPPKERPKTDYSSRKELVFSAPHSSRIWVQTAGTLSLGRSDTFQYAHLSEVAWWPHPSITMNSVQQAIPDAPGICQIWESTANGLGGLFYDTWQRAVEHRRKYPDNLDGFTPVFLPWTLDLAYSRQVPRGVEVEEIEGLTVEQSYWRERTIAEKCDGDVDLFMQEYPLTPDEAFRTSGRQVFGTGAIKHYRAGCKAGTYHVFAGGGLQSAHRKSNCWQIWNKPQKHSKYVLAADVMEGLLADPANPQSDPDYHAGIVFNRHTLAVDALWHGRSDTIEFGQQLVEAAKYYNTAWATPELNGPGLAVLNEFKKVDYPRIYQRQKPDEYPSDEEVAQYAWRTTRLNRPLMVSDLVWALSQRQIKLWSGLIVDEMMVFVRDKMGKAVHIAGGHDDTLLALMIALQLHLRLPLNEGSLDVESTFEQDAVQPGSGSMPSYALAGGCDDFDPSVDDFDDGAMG